jgi:hypothetical protein
LAHWAWWGTLRGRLVTVFIIFSGELVMKRVHLGACAAALGLVALVAAAAEAQQGKGRGGFGFGGFGGGSSSLVILAANEAVQKDLGISGDVAGKLNSLRDESSAATQKEYQTAGVSFQGFQNLSTEERQKLQGKMAEINKKLADEFDPKLKALVSADQYKRLEQIQLQANLQLRGPGSLTYSNIASELKLTDEQKKKLNDLQTESDAKQRELFSGGGFDREAFTKLREERTAKIMEVLTSDQKEKLNALKGPAFDVSQIGFGGRGRRGNN